MTSIDILRVRLALGRKEWGVPRKFGPDGWMLDRHDEESRIIISSAPPPINSGDMSDWLHASISRPNRMPAYEDLTMLHRAVWPDGWAYQVFAPPSKHINIHNFVLHLWGKPDGSIQLPEFGAMGTI